MPTRLLASYEAAITDPDMLNLTAEIGLHTTRLDDLLGKVDSGESGALWSDLRKAWVEFTEAQAAKDGAAMSALMREIGQLITRGYSDSAVWKEIGETIDRRRKLVDTERRRRIDMKTMITSERAGMMVLALTDSIRRNVDDPGVLNSILTDFGRIVGNDDRGATETE